MIDVVSVCSDTTSGHFSSVGAHMFLMCCADSQTHSGLQAFKALLGWLVEMSVDPLCSSGLPMLTAVDHVIKIRSLIPFWSRSTENLHSALGNVFLLQTFWWHKADCLSTQSAQWCCTGGLFILSANQQQQQLTDQWHNMPVINVNVCSSNGTGQHVSRNNSKPSKNLCVFLCVFAFCWWHACEELSVVLSSSMLSNPKSGHPHSVWQRQHRFLWEPTFGAPEDCWPTLEVRSTTSDRGVKNGPMVSCYKTSEKKLSFTHLLLQNPWAIALATITISWDNLTERQKTWQCS